MKNPTISVIIPILNEAAHLRELLPRLWKFANGHVTEIIVADAGSDDASEAVAKEFGAQYVHVGLKNRAAQMNAGAYIAISPYLYFVHADTLPPETYSTQIVKLLSKPEQMGCFRYQFRSNSLMLQFNAWFTRLPFLWCQGGDKTFFIRKECFDDLGGYNPYFCIMEEYDFLKRALPSRKLTVLADYASVSARKYASRSWLRVQIANAVVFNGWRVGVPPQKLVRWYQALLS